MVKIITQSVTQQDLRDLQEDYPGYIKIVADLKHKILAAGGEYHVDDEQVLIADGSRQNDLWGGGYDVATGGVDYFAMSNYRPSDGRVTYEIADAKIQRAFRELIYRYFPKQDG